VIIRTGTDKRRLRLARGLPLQFIAAWGPGLLVMLADTDAGNVVTAAVAGARWNYRILPLLILLIPVLYMVQELTVRFGVFTRRGFGELVRERFGRTWSWLAGAALTTSAVGSLVTQFTGIVGVSEIYSVPRWIALSLSAAALLAMAASGSYRRIERVVVLIGLFQFAFFIAAWSAHPNLKELLPGPADIPFGDRQFLYMTAAVVGAVFNPWMVFYQQSAVVDKSMTPADLPSQRCETLLGAILTQLLTAAVLIVAAASFGALSRPESFESVGAIVKALSYESGATVTAAFSVGVLGSAMLAAIVSSLAMAWGIGELTGHGRALEYQPFQARWFYGAYTVCVVGSAALAQFIPNLVQLNVTAQVLNAFLLPVVIGFLMILAIRALPRQARPDGWYLWLVATVSTAVCVLGLIGGVFGLL
jgi:Mn2+/Fe2+ NRAMP family transporter